MTISYNWISEYFPVVVDPERLSRILTSIGLEVESMEAYESVKGSLKGLVVGEVKESSPHPAADKLKLTRVDTGNGELLQIVCGAPNVAAGQKVIVAKTGTTIYPVAGEPITMKTAKIRGVESFGMICAEDEVGLGQDHSGIVVLPSALAVGSAVADYYKPYADWIYEIGLTPNRMDAMSHMGVARDVCAYLSHHDRQDIRIEKRQAARPAGAKPNLPFEVVIENNNACRRYCGVSITGIEVGESPLWLKQRLQSIGQRPINNIVDITNYILHDTGQPLHAFDANKVAGNRIIIKNLPENTVFTTLDEKERKLSNEDLMICDGNGKGLCIAGVFGGMDSGVKADTKNIFIESAWFNPIDVRKTSFRHGLRTDAAARFEKTVDISCTLEVLNHAAQLVTELAGGAVASDFIDVYPSPQPKTQVGLTFSHLKKLSGKEYDQETVKKILLSLGFELADPKGNVELSLLVPYSKPDIALQADVVEEIMRIDGYDNIAIPSSITITPSVGAGNPAHIRKEKTAGYLVGAGFSEIFTNSITNAAYFDSGELDGAVKLLNNLSAVHNIMRPSMLETGLESIAYNLNRKNDDLRFFEFGKTYHSTKPGSHAETEHLCLYVTGDRSPASWKSKSQPADFYYLKGQAEAVLQQCGLKAFTWEVAEDRKFSESVKLTVDGEIVARSGMVAKAELNRFGIKQPVFFADLDWERILAMIGGTVIRYTGLPNQLPVYRDLALVVSASLPYREVESAISKIKLEKLKSVELFDVFQSEKLGTGKKSMAISLTFQDDEKTLTDKEIDSMMSKIMRALEKDLSAEIRTGTQNVTS